MKVLVIDNYDSFTYNLVQAFGTLGADVQVLLNDAIAVADVALHAPSHLVISPGPSTPDRAGISLEAIAAYAGRLPILGVCLGHQAIAQVFGGRVLRAPRVMHGKTSLVRHRGEGLFAGLPNPFQATRYHSLVVQREGLPDCLEITAETDDIVPDIIPDVISQIMGLRHKSLDVEGVQFHPESFLTEGGLGLLANFLKRDLPRKGA